MVAVTEDVGVRGKKVTVVGLGIEGVDLVRFLARHGAEITVNDAKPAERLAERLEQIRDVPVRLLLGSNDAAATAEAEVVFASQGVPQDVPALAAARARGVPIRSMMQLFLRLCPAPVAGITGSSGKTTTTSLVGAMFAAAGRRHVVGGNIGVPLLSLLDEITPDTWVVLEISHSQLELTDRSPHVACVTNVTPNHLDRFTWEQYVDLKRNLVRHQRPGDVAVLNLDEPVSRGFAADTAARAVHFTTGGALPGDGTCIQDGWIVWQREGSRTPLLPVADIRLRGRHNVENVLAAAAVASVCGVEPEAVAAAVRSFRGVPHRLEPVARVGGATYYNDSIATTPERTLAGIRSFQEPLVLLLGGREKHLPLAELAAEACRRSRALVLFGEAASLLEAACRDAAAHHPPDRRPRLVRVETLEEAVREAHAVAQPGDVVLLSPACTSFDAYENFEQRGEHFRRLVRALPGAEEA